MKTQTETPRKATHHSAPQTPAQSVNQAATAVNSIKGFLGSLKADSPKLQAEIAAIQPENLEPETLKPYFENTGKGVFYVGVCSDNGALKYKSPVWLAGSFRIIGNATDTSGIYFRVIRWLDKNTHQEKTDVLPMGAIGTAVSIEWFRNRGIAVTPNKRLQEHLAQYLQSEGSNDVWHITYRVGWHGGAYILPSGEIIGDNPENIIYHGDKSQMSAYAVSGSLEDWQKNIGRYVSGNSRLMLALGTAFAAPLLKLADLENGGFHLHSDSSDGKTTAANTATSVWGKGGVDDGAGVKWNSTALAIENASLARNDNLLVLDEMGQANQRDIAKTAYNLFNGQGKMQGAKDGGNRVTNHWRILCFSTGEKAVETFISERQGKMHAGQAVRLSDIPAGADKGFGIYDTIHDKPTPAELSEHLNHSAARYYGTAGRAFIQALMADQHATAMIQTEMEAFLSVLHDTPLQGQARRVGKRFALIAAALILADHYDVLKLNRADIYTGVKACFSAWLEQTGGLGKREDREIIGHALDWFQSNANGLRIVSVKAVMDLHTPTPPNLAGYKEPWQEDDEIFYILPVVYRDEICDGYDERKVSKVLSDLDWLKKSGSGYQRQKRVKGGRQWFYVFYGSQPPEPEIEPNDEIPI